MRVIGAVLIASLVAVGFGLSIIAVSEESWWRFWGSVYGTFATVLVLGLALWVLNRRRRGASTLGRRVVIVTLTVFGLAVSYWVVLWGFSPFTLEGLWIYPLAAVPLALAFLMVLSRRHSRRDMWKRVPRDAD